MVTVEAKDLSAGILHVLQNSGEWINLQKTPKCDFLFSQHPEPPNCTGDYNDSHHSSIEKRAEIEILLKHHTDIGSVKAFFSSYLNMPMPKVITKSRVSRGTFESTESCNFK